MATTTPRRSRGLIHELLSSYRLTAFALAAMLLLSTVSSAYLILLSQPRLEETIMMTRLARDGHEAMLDQETGLRGWLATGDDTFLEPYDAGRRVADVNFEDMVAGSASTPGTTGPVIDTLVARERWQGWATRAAQTQFSATERTDGTLTRFLLEGKRLFDDYRDAEGAGLRQVQGLRDGALQSQRTALVVVFGCYLVLLLAAITLFSQRRRRARRRILEPVSSLLDTIEALREGDLSARTRPTEVPELHEIGTQVDQLAADLESERSHADQREQRLALMAQRLETVVRVGREISGSLSVRYVSATVTTAAADLVDHAATLWVRGEDQSFHVANRSEDAHGVLPPATLVAPEVVTQAAGEARPVVVAARGEDRGGSRAYPLVLAGIVTGVLEVATDVVDPDTEQVLDALLSAAASALESAHLHSSARELADHDALTRLPNRRRLELDIDEEWERCRRYGRPVTLVMLDLDHFKTVNDQRGHQVGDLVLREATAAIASTLRSTDTAYRYGGEEIVVLLRESALDDGVRCAERMRLAVAALRFSAAPDLSITVSAGVATRHTRMAHHSDLLARADGALYDAKRLGRDRVVAADDEPELPTRTRLLVPAETAAAAL